MKRLLVTVGSAIPTGDKQSFSENVVRQSRCARVVIVADNPVNDILRGSGKLSDWISWGISLSACFDLRVLNGDVTLDEQACRPISQEPQIFQALNLDPVNLARGRVNDFSGRVGVRGSRLEKLDRIFDLFLIKRQSKVVSRAEEPLCP